MNPFWSNIKCWMIKGQVLWDLDWFSLSVFSVNIIWMGCQLVMVMTIISKLVMEIGRGSYSLFKSEVSSHSGPIVIISYWSMTANYLRDSRLIIDHWWLSSWKFWGYTILPSWTSDITHTNYNKVWVWNLVLSRSVTLQFQSLNIANFIPTSIIHSS